MLKLLIVGAGGFLGSAARYATGMLALRLPVAHDFAYGTMIVNLVGCLLIGLLAGVVELRPDVISEEGRVFLFVGLLGGFTTFSAFGLDTLQLMRENAMGFALLNVGLQVTLGLLGVWVGMEALRFFLRA
jgi:CrcB protein